MTQDDVVRAPMDGVVLAARLTAESNAGEGGDAGFVLLRTRLELEGSERTIFTLLAHLKAHDPDGPPAQALERPEGRDIVDQDMRIEATHFLGLKGLNDGRYRGHAQPAATEPGEDVEQA